MKLFDKTEYAIAFYVLFFLAINLTGGTFFSDVGWAPYIQSDSNSNPTAGSAWVESDTVYWADGSNENYFSPTPSREGLVAAYHLDSGSGSTAVDDAYGYGSFRGIKKGVDTANLNFVKNQWGGNSNTGEIDITCSGGDSSCQFTRDGTTYSGSSVTAINNGLALDGQSKGTRYVMYSATSVHSRFTSPDPHDSNADHFIGVHYEDGQWHYDPNDNTADYAFTPQASDILVAEIEGKGADDSGSENSIQYVNSMNGFDASINGPTWTTGKYDDGLSFDGSDDYVEDTNPVNPTRKTDSMTVTFWLNPNSGTGTNGIVEWDNGAHIWQYNSEDDLFFNPKGTCNSFEATGAVTMDSWNHYAATYDKADSEFRLYRNGQIVHTSSQTCSPDTSNSPLRLGRRVGDSRVLNGELDEVRIYNRPLSPSEIEDLYRGSGGQTGASAGSMWVEDETIRWVDGLGYERSFTGTFETVEEDGALGEFTVEEPGNMNHGVVTSPKTKGEYARRIETTSGSDTDYEELTYSFTDRSPSWTNYSVRVPNPGNGNWVLKKQYHVNSNVVTSLAFDGSDANDISILNPSSGWTVVESNYPANTWMDVAIKWDWANNQVDVYIDGEQKITNHGFRTSASSVDSIREFWDYREGTVTGYIDGETLPDNSYTPAASLGNAWMEAGNLHYIDGSGKERVIAE